uniref:hypothetical protein n=1 Tax=Methylibium sp. TaxID=2067992 RepID=UPI0017E4D679
CRTLPATSIGGETWQAPVILTEDGERAYLVRYAGRDYLPQPSVVQARCEAVAQSARAGIRDGIDMAPACHWSAVLLAAANYVSEGTIAALGLLDDQLVAQVLGAGTGMPLTHQVAP